MRQISRRIMHDPPDDWLKTGWARDSQTRSRLVDSLICITCLLENNGFFVLHYVMVALHYSMLHRFEIFSAPGTIAHGSIRPPPRSLASLRGCSLANAIRVHKSLALSQLDIVYFLQYQSACFAKSIDLEFRWVTWIQWDILIRKINKRESRYWTSRLQPRLFLRLISSIPCIITNPLFLHPRFKNTH